MTLYKNVDGVRIEMTAQEETDFEDSRKPPTQAEIDAAQEEELDALVSEIDTGKSLLRALGVEVFKLAKVADPTLTPAQFKKRIRNTAEGF